jgi:hypothetical protein
MQFQYIFASFAILTSTPLVLLAEASGVSIPAKGITPKYCPVPPYNSFAIRDRIQGGQGNKVILDMEGAELTLYLKPKYQLYHASWVGQISGKKLKIYHCAEAMGAKITKAQYALVKWTLIETRELPLPELD